MKFIDLTFDSPQHNLACDEALLDWCEDGFADEILRFWESPKEFVVLGYSNKAGTEVHLDRARGDDVSVLRRCSGGGAVLQGPGCLNYTLVLRIPDSGPLASITGTNRFILDRHRAALSALWRVGLQPDRKSPSRGGSAGAEPSKGPEVNPIRVQGQTDLALGDLKFSGNAQRRKRRFLLFHGTFLLNFDIDRVERLLPMPSRQPDYRAHRPHEDFLTNLNRDSRSVRDALTELWKATEPLRDLPSERIEQLAGARYSDDDWNFKF